MRSFYVEGTVYTALSYGEFMLTKQFNESDGATVNPSKLSSSEIEQIGLNILEERMTESEDVYPLHS